MPAVSISKQDSLSATFAALSDPTRRAMLKRLSQGEATVNDLAAPFKMSLPAISKHIKVLEKAGLLTKTVQKQQRPCKLNGTKLKQAIDWIDQYKLLWEGRIDRLDEVAKSLQTTETTISAAAVSSKEEIAADTVKSDLATNLIATQAINTPPTPQKDQINSPKIESPQTKTKAATKSNRKKKEDDGTQPQIGFDF
ncbi:MAG TPA: metalloregulator ArsR/SmtB family transcription factor [Burkholderiaceae bacterium]|nr:metalloregulator ArsR/SmtB family transcription factor [Burkholderiaceae bacterium]